MKNSIDNLKGTLIKIEFDFETENFDFFVGFSNNWIVNFSSNVDYELTEKLNDTVGYMIRPAKGFTSNDVINEINSIIKINLKYEDALKKIEQQKNKLQNKIFKKKIKIVEPENNIDSNEIEYRETSFDRTSED